MKHSIINIIFNEPEDRYFIMTTRTHFYYCQDTEVLFSPFLSEEVVVSSKLTVNINRIKGLPNILAYMEFDFDAESYAKFTKILYVENV